MTREEAINNLKKILGFSPTYDEAFYTLFPEPKESEDERIRREIVDFICWAIDRGSITEEQRERSDTWLAYLEKQKEQPTNEEMLRTLRAEYEKGVADTIAKYEQKEQKPNIELIQRSWYMEGYHDREFGKEPKWIIKTGEGGPKHELNPRYGQPLTEQQVTEEQLHNLNEAIKGLRMDGCERIADSLHSLYIFLKSTYHQPTQEQKPVSPEDMPYITDEHFFEREPKDSFKYKLAEYMTKNCTGYSYSISSESILEMAEEELLKRGVVQKPAEWSEEEYGRLFDIEHYLDGTLQLSPDRKIACIDFLKSLRPPQDRCKDCPHRGDMFLLTQGVKSGKHELAIKFMDYLDENRPEGKTCLSNGECEDIDKAFKEGDWAKIIRYIEKYSPSWKPSEEQSIKGD